MYVPILSIDGVVVDWFVPPESSIHSRLWSDYILKSINQWWMNKWARLSTADRERIQQCVSDAISAGKKRVFIRKDLVPESHYQAKSTFTSLNHY